MHFTVKYETCCIQQTSDGLTDLHIFIFWIVKVLFFNKLIKYISGKTMSDTIYYSKRSIFRCLQTCQDRVFNIAPELESSLLRGYEGNPAVCENNSSFVKLVITIN